MSLTISDAGIDVQISRETRSPSQRGFGTLLFLNPVPTVTQRLKSYTSLSGVAVDYNAVDEPYKSALAFYSQSPSPIDFMVGELQEGTPLIAGVKATGSLEYSGLATNSNPAIFDIDSDTYTVTGIVADVVAAQAIGTFDISGSAVAAGDGDVGVAIDGSPYVTSPTAGDSATDTADVIAGLISGSATHTASNSGGTITITSVNTGSAENAISLADISTDTGTTGGSVTPFAGGLDAVAGSTGSDIATLMAGQINTGSTHTATVAGDVVTIIDVTAGVAGNTVVFADVSDPAGISPAVSQPSGGSEAIPATAGENLSDALDDMMSIDGDFYCVNVAQGINDTPDADDVAKWAQANERMYFAITSDANSKIVGNTSNQMYDFQVQGYDRTMITYSNSQDDYVCSSAFGMLATTSFRGTNTLKTLKFKNMPGVAIEMLSANDLAGIKEKWGNVFYMTAGIRMFDEGKTSGGSWADEIHGMDALAEQIRVNVFGLLARVSTKVPNNEPGVAQLEAQVEQALGQYVTNGYLTTRVDTNGDILPAYTIWHIPVIDAPIADKSARISPDIQFTARLAGAIHEILINGVLTLD